MFELSAGRALRLMLGLRLQRIRNGFYPAKTESGRRRATPTVNRVGAVSSLLFGLAFIALMFFAELESQREAVEAGRGSEAFVIAVARGMLLANMFPFMFSMRPTELSDDIQWLLTLPIQARTLLVARGLEQALVNIFGVFFMLIPLVARTWVFAESVGACAIAGLIGVSLLFFASMFFTLVTGLLRHLSPGISKVVLGIFAACGMAPLASGVVDLDGLDPYVRASGIEVLLALPGWSASGVLPAMAAVTGLVAVTGLAGWVSLDLALRLGLQPAKGGASRRGRRSRKAPRSIIAKDLLAFRRTPHLMIATLAMPIFIALPIWIKGLGTNVAKKGLEAEVIAGAAWGSVMFTLGLLPMLLMSLEGRAFWIVLTTPRRLAWLIIDKMGLVVLVCVLTVVLGFGWPAVQVGLSLELGLRLAAVGAGIICIAGLGTAEALVAFDPSGTGAQQRYRSTYGAIYFFFFAWIAVIAAPNPVQALPALVFATAIGVAVFEKVFVAFPYLYDPSSAPPPRPMLVDALWALLVLLVGTGVINWYFEGETLLDWSRGYAVMGIVTLLGVSAQRKLRGELSPTDHLVRPEGTWRAGFTHGLIWGLPLALLVLLVMPSYRAWSGLPLVEASEIFGLTVLAVGVAPFIEEPIFRGLLLSTLGRYVRSAAAIVLAAVFFAACHPLGAAPPVFVLGLCAGAAFIRSGSLSAAVIVHVLYNSAVCWEAWQASMGG